jgi:hypothetical protein
MSLDLDCVFIAVPVFVEAAFDDYRKYYFSNIEIFKC